MKKSKIAIMGAGIMGCCLALELANRGYKVDLIDLSPIPMTGASLHNEGKIHLGFVYANDPLKETHKLMVKGALSFSRIFKHLTGYGPDKLHISRPFHYFVPNNSQLSINTIEKHFRNVNESIQEEVSRSGGSYLGFRGEQYYQRNSDEVHERYFTKNLTVGSFKTEERSVSPTAVATILREKINSTSNINFIGKTRVLSVNRFHNGEIKIKTTKEANITDNIYDCVLNCLWDDRIRVDHTAGINDSGPWYFRYKVTINIKQTEDRGNSIPSATGILGTYGDVVNHNNGSYYISWYPKCKIGQSTSVECRTLHDKVHKSIMTNVIRRVESSFPTISNYLASLPHMRFIDHNIHSMAAYIPSIIRLSRFKLRAKLGGGIIVARGRTDIQDPKSVLHQRSQIGPVAYGSYITIDTGKYGMAPYFSLKTADMIDDILK
jgi:hypothetical protein